MASTELNEKLSGIQSMREKAVRDHLLDLAREEFAKRGLATELKDVAARAELHSSSLYRYFPEGTRSMVIALLEKSLGEALIAQERIDKIGDARAALIAWMRHCIHFTARYGHLVHDLIDPDSCPDWVEAWSRAKCDEYGLEHRTGPGPVMFRHTGHLVRRCKACGALLPTIPTEYQVRDFWTIVHPFRVRWALRQGLCLEELLTNSAHRFFKAGSCAMPMALPSA